MCKNHLIYWNNVCLLSRMEEEFIDIDKNIWMKTNNEKFEFEYFGLGRPKSLNQKISEELKEEKIKADVIISTDLDVFEDKRLLYPLLNNYRNLSDIFEIREEVKKTNIFYKKGNIAPFIVIPLVIVVNKSLIEKQRIPKSFNDLFNPFYKDKIVFGGIHNSAGKSLLKSLWYFYGKEKVEKFVSNSKVTSMPALAFSKVMKGEVPIAIVPSIFAMRKGNKDIIGIWPKEGAIAIPSYIAINKDFPKESIGFLKDRLLNIKKQNLFSERGNVIPTHPQAILPDWAKENKCKLLYPNWKWLDTFDTSKFDELCNTVRLTS